MFNNIREFLLSKASHNKPSLSTLFYSFTLALVLASGVIGVAKADVCFLPDGQDCEKVPYKEYDCSGDDCNQEPAKECKASNYCYATEAEAIAARGATRSTGRSGIRTTRELDSYSFEDGCYCLKHSCGAVASTLAGNRRDAYTLSGSKGEGWMCEQCTDTKSKYHNNYRCTAKECVNSSVSCVTGGDECKKCVDMGYSGDNVCQELQTIDAHCPEGYVPDKPSSKCYSTQDMVCGEGKCYRAATTIPECSGGKQLFDDNGACWCSCPEGYDDVNGQCVLNTTDQPITDQPNSDSDNGGNGGDNGGNNDGDNGDDNGGDNDGDNNSSVVDARVNIRFVSTAAEAIGGSNFDENTTSQITIGQSAQEIASTGYFKAVVSGDDTEVVDSLKGLLTQLSFNRTNQYKIKIDVTCKDGDTSTVSPVILDGLVDGDYYACDGDELAYINKITVSCKNIAGRGSTYNPEQIVLEPGGPAVKSCTIGNWNVEFAMPIAVGTM